MHLKKYYRQVRRLLPCTRKTKAAIMQQIYDNVEGYLAEHPAADFAQLQAQFGAQESIAAACVESTGTAEILKSLQMRRRIVSILAAVGLAALLVWTAYVIWTAVKVNRVLNSLDGSYDDTYIVEGTVEMDPQGTDSVSYAP